MKKNLIWKILLSLGICPFVIPLITGIYNMSIQLMDTYLEQNGYANDFSESRLHHEIYLSDARKVAPNKWRTVIRHPIKKV